MSAAISNTISLITSTLRSILLNPLISGPLLWALTKGPASLRATLRSNLPLLQDPRRYAQLVRILKYGLALGVAGTVNTQLNTVALNAGRWGSLQSRYVWEREVAVVTGGSSGIGELIVKRLLSMGIRVCVLDIQPLPASLKGNSRVTFYECDITDPEAVYSTAENIRSAHGHPSVLINNAGILSSHTILNTSDSYLRKIFDVNVLSNWYTTKAFLPAMLSANKGHIVTIASTASYIGVGGLADYTATKAAILSFHEGLNQELKHHYGNKDILTTSVHPNWVRTPLLEPVVKELERRGSYIIEPEEVADKVVNQIRSCVGGQIYLPESVAKVGFLRGVPNWFQESLRDGTTKTIADSSK